MCHSFVCLTLAQHYGKSVMPTLLRTACLVSPTRILMSSNEPDVPLFSVFTKNFYVLQAVQSLTARLWSNEDNRRIGYLVHVTCFEIEHHSPGRGFFFLLSEPLVTCGSSELARALLVGRRPSAIPRRVNPETRFGWSHSGGGATVLPK